MPEKTDCTCLENTLLLSVPYVKRMVITRMLPSIKVDIRVLIKDDRSGAENDIEEAPKLHHFN